MSAIRSSSFGPSTVHLALPDLLHHRVHIGVVPDLGEFAVFEAIKSELRNSHPTTGRLNSLEGPPVGTGDREVHRDIVAVDNEGPHLLMPVRKCGEQRRELRRNGGWIHRDVIDLDGRRIKLGHLIKIVLIAVLKIRQGQGSVFIVLGHLFSPPHGSGFRKPSGVCRELAPPVYQTSSIPVPSEIASRNSGFRNWRKVCLTYRPLGSLQGGWIWH